MQSKLTLTLEDELIKSAKEYAKSRQKTLSQIVAEYFSTVGSQKPKTIDQKGRALGPVTSRLVGSLKGADLNEGDYKDHLRRKYL